MSLSTNKIILSGAQTNTAGAYFLTTTLSAVSTGNGTVIPAGVYLMFPQANTSILAYNGSANATLIAANTGGVIISDGVNVFAKSTGTDTVTLLATNGGQAVSSTFAS
jgi:3D (Asp-Asp-Asp) domain-containing protein